MNQSTVFRRKLIYLVVLLAMLIPLFLLGQPSAGRGDAGGRLAEMRVKYNIAESDLGEISPASETMKLASLGLRGVAATLLWNKAHDYRVAHEWDRLKATLNNIALLQPHYDKVWEHQAHNLAYNFSIEFDDYRQRYEMVREGTEFLTRGVRQNKRAPRLIWYTGWFYGQKMGVSDERIQFRRLFSDDQVLHNSLMDEGIPVDSPEALGPFQKPDNWLVGRLWLNRGYDLVDNGGVKIRRQTPINFYETGPKWRIKHAEAIEKEGILDGRAREAWVDASKDWNAFGKRSIPTLMPFSVKLGELDDLEERYQQKMFEFRNLTGDAFLDAVKANTKDLPQDLQDVIDTPPEDRTEAGKSFMEYLANTVNVADVARAADPSVRLAAVNMVGEMKDLKERHNKTRGYREQINYPYWETLAQAEQEQDTIDARKLIYDAEKANDDAEIDKAIKLYEEAFELWAVIFDRYPILTIDDSADNLYDSIRHYLIATDSQELPETFPLYDFAVMMRDNGSVDAKQYEIYRKTQKEKAAARKLELEAEEKRLEEAEKEAEEKDMKLSAPDESAESDPPSKAPAPKSGSEEGEKEMKADAKAKSDTSDGSKEGAKPASKKETEVL